MLNSPIRSLSYLWLCLLVLGAGEASAQKLSTLETPRYRILHDKKHADVAAEILEIAESVWPTLARAYDAYGHYQRIDIIVLDESDQANGYAIYPWSQVAIFVPHMDWILRNRQIWLRNVVTHELAHIFTLRRAAHLAPIDFAQVTGVTYSATDRVNWSFAVPWVPLIAPNWYVEGIAQFEAEQHGNDNWDSQRDMLVRDAWLTGTLPTLEYIETFDRSRDWIQGERVYNTGYAFLRYLKDRFGVEKVRALADPKPFFNFSSAVEETFGKPLPDLFEDWKRSLAERYEDFKDLPVDVPADPDMPGSFHQNLAFSSDGRYMAWLGNDDDRRAPLNWIFWKEIGKPGIRKSDKPVSAPDPAESTQEEKEPAPEPQPEPEPRPDGITAAGFDPSSSLPGFSRFGAHNGILGQARRYRDPGRATRALSPARMVKRNHRAVERSRELGSEGLEFNRDNTRLLTSRQDYDYAAYTDLWEYEFRSTKPESQKWRRLTWEERASYPSYHPTQDLIVFVRKKAGSTNLAILDSTGRIAQITRFTGGEQAFNPRFTPQGDSVYFTLQVGEKEAIAAISASAPGFDPMAAARDTAARFPDSLNFARGESVRLVTPLRPGGIRNLVFAGDTLYFSSNMHDTAHSTVSVYDVYARVPGDSLLHRATRVRGQALEPVVRDGILYYQGFHRQQVKFSRVPLALERTGTVLASPVDTVPRAKPKKVDWSKHLETGEPHAPKFAQEIYPYLVLRPQILTNNRIYTDVALGVNATFGGPTGNWSQTVGGDISKRADLDDPLSYSLFYAGYLSAQPIRHTRQTWHPSLSYWLAHEMVEVEDVIRRSMVDTTTSDMFDINDRIVVGGRYLRNYAQGFVPLPYNFGVDAGFFRQAATESYSRRYVVTQRTAGDEVVFDTAFSVKLLQDAPQHRHFNTGLGWSWSKGMVGTWLPTGVGVFTGVRKWWVDYAEDALQVDSLFRQIQAEAGRPEAELVLQQAEFNPWSLDLGVAGALSEGSLLTLFGSLEAGTFLSKFPMDETTVHWNGSEPVLGRETAQYLWVLPYQLGGFFQMPGYPYNFRYRGRDIMEGTSMARGQVGVRIPIPFGFFIPSSPLTSFREFSVTAVMNGGTTLISAPDRVLSDLEDGKHHLLLDYGVRLNWNFRIYHQYPFSFYLQGFRPYNRLKASRLFWYDYPHTGPVNELDGTPSAIQLANDARDRAEYIKLVKENRYFVGFQLGF